jgi:hypothetical protein
MEGLKISPYKPNTPRVCVYYGPVWCLTSGATPRLSCGGCDSKSVAGGDSLDVIPNSPYIYWMDLCSKKYVGWIRTFVGQCGFHARRRRLRFCGDIYIRPHLYSRRRYTCSRSGYDASLSVAVIRRPESATTTLRHRRDGIQLVCGRCLPAAQDRRTARIGHRLALHCSWMVGLGPRVLLPVGGGWLGHQLRTYLPLLHMHAQMQFPSLLLLDRSIGRSPGPEHRRRTPHQAARHRTVLLPS